MIGRYEMHVSSVDLYAALDCEAKRAEREGMKGTAVRQSKTALHLQNACIHMQSVRPDGYRLQTTICIELVPDVNAVLKPEYRKGN